MLAVEATISRVRRDLVLSFLLRTLLACALFGSFVAVGPENVRIVALLGVGSVWVWLSVNSARSFRAAAESPTLIAAGQFEAAERNIEQTVLTFSMVRSVKLQALHHLAMLRHAQRRWQESALLSRALLGQRLGTLQTLSKPTRLLLADSLLEMNDVRGAYDAIANLHGEQLALREVLNLLAIQTDYSARVGAWPHMMNNFMAKVELAELLPAESNARTQAFLALAAKKVGREDVFRWLRARAELLADATQLVAQRPMLAVVWNEQ